MNIYIAPVISLLAGYASYWLSLATPGTPLLRPFLGCAGYEALRNKGRLWFWGWGAVLVVFWLMVWARVGVWSRPTDLDMRMVALSVFFMAGIWGGYTHFRSIPRESWRS